MGSDSDKHNKLIENQHFLDIRIGLKESFFNISKTLDKINNWDELINLKEESIEEIIIKNTKTFNKQKYNSCGKCILFLCGVFFCILQLIIVQSSIIILNSLFSEIVEEFKLWFNNNPREHNFYERLEINTYRELPEIDVGMITSSIGIIFLKSCGFFTSFLTFHLSSLIWFLLLFLLFDFHTGASLLENYTRLEIAILVLSYVFLSFLVGCSSTIALKEFNDIYFGFYKKTDNKERREKIIFYVFSGISAFIIMPINRKIFTSFKDKISKNILKWIEIICFICFALSLIFYKLYLRPITTKEKNKKKKKINIKNPQNQLKDENKKGDIIKEIKKENKKENINKDIQKKNKKEVDIYIRNYNERYDSGKQNQYATEGKGENTKNIFINESEGEKAEISKKIKKKNEDITPKNLESECATIKFNQSFTENKEQIDSIRKNKLKKISKREIYSTKICTLCGYIYIRKTSTKKSECICYYYTNKCSWFKEKMLNKEVIIPFFIELYCQICVIGFNPILTEKLLNEYSYSKNIKFYSALIILINTFVILLIFILPNEDEQKEEEKEKKEKNDSDSCNKKICDLLGYNFIYLFGFFIFTFISSICYYSADNLNKERWNNIIMAEIIFFKVIDFRILSYFDFFDNSDIFNTTLSITVEKLLWMIIETIIDIYVENKKALVLVQIIASSLIPGIFFLILVFYLIILCI